LLRSSWGLRSSIPRGLPRGSSFFSIDFLAPQYIGPFHRTLPTKYEGPIKEELGISLGEEDEDGKISFS
jgi:hypothetical protein